MHHQENHWLQQKIEKLQRGDKAAFDAIFHTFEAKVFAFAFKLTHSTEDAKEVVQEVFLKVWERREQLDPQFKFDSFLFTIAKNLVYNKTRHRVYEFAYHEYALKFRSQTEPVTENMVNLMELQTIIDSACNELPPVRREVFMMSRVQGLSNNEIAEKLNTSTSNIKNHIFKALIFLKEQIRIHNLVRGILLLSTFL